MTKLFIVDTIVTYRMRYVIRGNELEHCMDEITMRDSGNDKDYFEEFSQKCLGEQIADGREITMDEFNLMLVEDKNASSWMGEKLIRDIKYEKD